MLKQKYAIIIPAQNEEAVIGQTIDSLKSVIPDNCYISVGLNNCDDSTREICEDRGVTVGETQSSGYGYGCQTAVDAIDSVIEPDAYIFFAADGANDPNDVVRLIQKYEASATRFVMGIRKFELTNWLDEIGRSLPNLILGMACRFLGGQFFYDLGPLRLIEAKLFHEFALEEMVWGWTMEAQIKAAYAGENIESILVTESERKAGEQKISGVSIWRSSQVGWEILKAAYLTRSRILSQPKEREPGKEVAISRPRALEPHVN